MLLYGFMQNMHENRMHFSRTKISTDCEPLLAAMDIEYIL